MKHRGRNTERGQTAVLVALLMVGLLVGTGLAIDGGTAFLERRRMQNAADAAAMGGARDLVMSRIDEEGVDDAAIRETVDHYAEVNGVEDPQNKVVAHYVDENSGVLAPVGDGSIPPAATGISATVRIERAARFMQVIGLDTVPAQAFSLAQTGAPDGDWSWLRPFGLPREVFEGFEDQDGTEYEGLEPGDSLRIHFGNKNQCGPEVEGNVCNVIWTTNAGEVSQAHRGWWNYNKVYEPGEAGNCSSTGGASDLKEWMEDGWEGPIDEDYTVCSKPGETRSVFDSAPPPTELVCIPVWDDFDESNRYVVHDVTPVYITEVHKGGNDPWLEITLAAGECPGSLDDPDATSAFNAWTLTQWE